MHACHHHLWNGLDGLHHFGAGIEHFICGCVIGAKHVTKIMTRRKNGASGSKDDPGGIALPHRGKSLREFFQHRQRQRIAFFWLIQREGHHIARALYFHQFRHDPILPWKKCLTDGIY